MNAALQKSLDAIEQSLANLIETVVADDPSADVATALVAADDDLSANLEQLVTHQTNHHRLLHLRALSTALDAELSTLLSTLAAARQELQAKPSTVFPAHARQVEYDTLLTYATKISKFTRPPTHFTHQQRAAAAVAAAKAATEGSSTALVKADVNGDVPAGGAAAGAGAAAANKPAEGEGSTNAKTQPTAEDIALLDPSANISFVPWPSEDVMKRGVLANMAYLESVPDGAAADAAGEGGAAPGGEQAMAEGGQPGPSGRPQMSDADKQKAREEAERKEAERKAREQEVVSGFDLYDPDSD